MRQILPEPAEIEPFPAHAAMERPAPPDRPWVLLNVITSVDGATAVDGRSGPLGGPADHQVFAALRAVADVILAGATTVVTERYRPPQTSPEQQEARLARGQRAKPRIAVVSGRLNLPVDLPLFGDPSERPIVLTTERADAGRRRELSEVADVVSVGEVTVDLAAALRGLRADGCASVLCEGGATLNGGLAEADLVDEVDLTLSPTLVAGDAPRLARGEHAVLHRLRLAHLWEADGLLFHRYLRDT